MKLWGGRFTKGTEQIVHTFNASIRFDQKLVLYDIKGSVAHAKMLGQQSIITEKEAEEIISGLLSIQEDLDADRLTIDMNAEDIHSFIESTLIERIGVTGKKLHTGRSRNDQVATDMKLYTKAEIIHISSLVKNLLTTLMNIMEDNLDTYMPGYTHLQKAQPITLAHHFGAYFEMFRRDQSRLMDTYHRMDTLPLGAGALATTTYPINRYYTAHHLNFKDIAKNSIDSVADRDYLIELLSNLSILMMHLSRFCEEIILWCSLEWQFVELDDAYSTGSSIMPQKKNPDIPELIRGKTGRVYGALTSLLTLMKSLPLAYNKDMQEDKEPSFDAIETVKDCLTLFEAMLSTMTFNKNQMKESALLGFTNATDAADYLVKKKVPFRDAHEIIGKLVLYCLDKNISLEQLTLLEYQEISSYFEVDIYDAISLKTCVESRSIIGGPSSNAMSEVLKEYKNYLANI